MTREGGYADSSVDCRPWTLDRRPFLPCTLTPALWVFYHEEHDGKEGDHEEKRLNVRATPLWLPYDVGAGPFGACPYRQISQSHRNFEMTCAGFVILRLDRRIQ